MKTNAAVMFVTADSGGHVDAMFDEGFAKAIEWLSKQ